MRLRTDFYAKHTWRGCTFGGRTTPSAESTEGMYIKQTYVPKSAMLSGCRAPSQSGGAFVAHEKQTNQAASPSSCLSIDQRMMKQPSQGGALHGRVVGGHYRLPGLVNDSGGCCTLLSYRDGWFRPCPDGSFAGFTRSSFWGTARGILSLICLSFHALRHRPHTSQSI